MAKRIDVKDLDVYYGKFKAVEGVTMTVEPRSVTALIGPSGCGKSTVLRAMSGLNPDWSGSLSLDGQTLGHRRDKAFYKHCQMVFQDPYGSLHPRHTVDRILAEPVAIHGLGDADKRIDRTLREVGLGPQFRFRFPHQLSGGQRQRVAIARALILEPRVLLLDEPTSALDVSVQAEILNLLKRLRAEHALTYILVSHNLAVVAYMCDRLAVMNRGRVVEELDAENLRRGEARQDYTRQLLLASQGYDRTVADSFKDFS